MFSHRPYCFLTGEKQKRIIKTLQFPVGQQRLRGVISVKVRTIRLFPILAVLIAGLFFLGPMLIHRDPIKPVDAVVLLLGNDATRVPEAMALLQEGWAKTLIVAAEGQVSEFSGDGKLSLRKKFRIEELLNTVKQKENYKAFWENTHIELCLAREIMARENITTIAMVTSPYHTRRVQFMAYRVFSDKNDIVVIPSRFEKTHGVRWMFNKNEQKSVFLESLKNVWFFVYSVFS
jgi:hypothetical protein